MRYWTDYVCTKPEVDDVDLPLPEHRLFDDEGRVRHAVEAHVRSMLQRAKASARKATHLTNQRRVALLRAVGAKWTRRPTPVLPLEHVVSSSEEEEVRPATSPAKSPAKSRASRSSVGSVGRAATPKRASTSRSPSRSRSRPSSARKVVPSPSPMRAATPAKKAAKKSSSRARSGARSASRAGSRARSAPRSAKKAPKTPTPTPSPKWTVTALKAYAKENSIKITGLKNKTDILGAIEKAE